MSEDDLVKRLRQADMDSAQRIAGSRIFGEAAERIEALARERGEANGWVAMIRDERDTAIRQRNSWQDKAEAAEAALAAMTAERDSALKAFGEQVAAKTKLQVRLAEVKAERDAAEAALAAMTKECGSYLAVWAVRHAEINGLPDGEIHPQHYDRMAELGCRMDSFRRATLSEIGGA